MTRKTVKPKKPWFKFYPENWIGDQGVRAASPAARALWIDMLCIMHKAMPYGHLVINGGPMSPETLARISGFPVEQVTALLDELRGLDVYSMTRAGIIYSRRMVRDERATKSGRNSAEKRWEREKRTTSQTTDNTVNSHPPNRSARGIPHAYMPEARGQRLEDGTEISKVPEPPENISSSASAAGAADGDLGPELIRAFDDSRAATWGANLRRPWPDARDVVTAGQWAAAGLTVEECRRVCDAVNAKLKAKGFGPRNMLKALDGDVQNYLAAKITPPLAGDPSRAAVKPPPRIDWDGLVAIYRQYDCRPSAWGDRLGPRPGEPGCRAPADVLQKYGFEVSHAA